MSTNIQILEKKLPRVISKKELCVVLDCMTSTNEPNYIRLREKFFPPYIITEKLELSVEKYNSIKTFDWIVTARIYEVLNITADEYYKVMQPSKK